MFTKVTKKVVAIALMLSLALSAAVVAPAGDSAAAPKKFKVNKKKAAVSVGKTITLSATKKAKWTVKPATVAKVNKKSSKKVKVEGLSRGKATVTAKAGKLKATCVVTVKAATSGTVIYDLAKETGVDEESGESYAPPVRCNYTDFRYSNFSIWLCRATFYNPAEQGNDYRGQKLNCSVTFQNTGARDLPELGFAFNYTKSSSDGAYPFALHIHAKGLDAKVKKDNQHKHCKIVKAAIKKGKTYTYNFTFTIPRDAMNGDKDEETGINYPIMFYCTNLKDSSPYKVGDEVTIKKCKFTVA
ncbi:MAG: hypothetical protein LBR68_05300 [Lachnoclostridium sp.]|jgi:hypothetical protein|nr:hypothetical protein [Lachnoclostridium sp.]